METETGKWELEQKTGIRNWKLELEMATGILYNWKAETEAGNWKWKLEHCNWELEVESGALQLETGTGKWKQELESGSRNWKLELETVTWAAFGMG